MPAGQQAFRQSSAAALRAFSLMELLVAIMILGLGMVMVATVFPVGMDISRDTIQMSISLAAADAAAATLALRLPVEKELNRFLDAPPGGSDILAGIALGPIPLPEVPDAYDAVVDPVEWLAFKPPFVPAELNTPRDQGARGPLFARLFTESTRWDGDAAAYGPVVEQAVHTAFAVRAMNLSDGVHQPLHELSPYIDLGVSPAPAPPRLHVADRVYPPVTVNAHYPPGEVIYEAFSPQTPIMVRGGGLYYPDEAYCDRYFFAPWECRALDTSIRPEPNWPSELDWTVAAQAALRRYAWTAFQHKLAPNANLRSFLATIAVTYRAGLNEIYAQQASLNDPDVPGLQIRPDIDDPNLPTNVRAAIRSPRPALDPRYDVLFPVPWLVEMRMIDSAAGRAECTAAVAELLPPGSMFIIAVSPLQNGWPVMQAGTARKVLANNWQPADRAVRGDQNVLRQLEIVRGNEEAVGPVLVWVFPPPITRGGPEGWVYGTRSPVVGVFIREVTP